MGPMEENRDDNVGSTRGGSIHPDVANMDNMLPPIRDYVHRSGVTPPVIRRPTISSSSPSLSNYYKEFSSTGSHMRIRMLIS